MAIPKVEIGQINNAFRLFDSEYRNSIDWIGWETRKTQKNKLSGRVLFIPAYPAFNND
jgi:hypothetical protein